MEPQVAQAVQKVARDVFQSMVFLPLEAMVPRALGENQTRYDLTGTIGLSGDSPGAVGVRFPKALAAKVASAMLGSPITEDSLEVQQTVGELTNMIAGGMKNELDPAGIRFDISIPTVIAGDQHTFNILANVDGIVVPFNVDGSQFVVEVCMKRK